MKVLLIEDDHSVVGALSAVLLHHGFEVIVAQTAASALRRLDQSVDVVLLDLGLPDRDGLQICGEIRALTDAGILIVTARDDPRSRVHGLDLGADDYVVKPYDSRELLARLYAVIRRRHRSSPPRMRAQRPGTVRIDQARRAVHINGSPVQLTRSEFDVLGLLARYPGVVVRYEQFISELWEGSWPGVKHTLRMHVAAIRAKCGQADIIETVRGIGYRLKDD